MPASTTTELDRDPADVEAEEAAAIEAKAEAKGGGFWATFAAKAEVHGGKLGAMSKKKKLELTEGAYEDILEGRLEEGRELISQYELAKGPTAGESKVTVQGGGASALAYGRAVPLRRGTRVGFFLETAPISVVFQSFRLIFRRAIIFSKG